MNSTTMKKSLQGAMMATAAGAMVLAGTGVASATHLAALPGTPTAANQVCGTVYSNASWVSNGAIPAGAKGVHGATVTGTLSSTSWTDSVVTDDNGRWCLEGDAGMAGDVAGGAYVTLTMTYAGATQTWTNSGSSNINSSVFLAHGVWMGGLLPVSAKSFYFAV